ncbi:hypothetical protein [Kitasatospora sp. P5_F3]
MSGPYELRVCDLRTDQTLDLLPISDAAYEDYIGKTGSLSGTVPIPNRQLATRARESLIPARTMLYLERGGQIVWGGVLWTSTLVLANRSLGLQIGAGSLEGFLRNHRLLYTGGGGTADQLVIARQLLAFAQFGTGANLLIETDPTQLSGVVRDRVYLGQDQEPIGVLLDQLGAVANGFEWRVQCYTDSAGVRHRAFRLGYPTLTVQQEITLDVPGRVVAYSFPSDGSAMATQWRSRGASVNDDSSQDSYPLLSDLLSTPALIAAGWPVLHGTSDYSTVDVPATLTEHASADLARASAPVVVPAVTFLVGDGGVPLLGSSARLRITDDWHPAPGLNQRYRIVGYRVSPEERDRPETCDLYLEAA